LINGFQKLFHLDGRKADSAESVTHSVSLAIDEATFVQSRLHSMLEVVFDNLVPRILSLTSTPVSSIVNPTIISSTETHDGIESIAMLTTLTQYLESFTEVLQVASDDSQRVEWCHDGMYLGKTLRTLQQQLEQNIVLFGNEQIQWIHSQRADPKSPNVLLPFLRFPSIVLHIVQMTTGKVCKLSPLNIDILVYFLLHFSVGF
jgi:hypothetical protein